jgi:hypothetical protein
VLALADCSIKAPSGGNIREVLHTCVPIGFILWRHVDTGSAWWHTEAEDRGTGHRGGTLAYTSPSTFQLSPLVVSFLSISPFPGEDFRARGNRKG